MAKFLRLAFHDCMKYADGTGGCDGCLEWTGVGERFAREEHGKMELNASDDGHNNGLQPTVEILERIYTDPTFPNLAMSLPQSPRDSGLSRADLWAFAGMVAVEHGVQLNNLACGKQDLDDAGGILGQCHPRVGEADCEVVAPQPFYFASGRRDCIPDPTVDKPYKTFKKELHPDPGANGSAALDYFKRDFGFNARETVAILGAHTLGRVHNTISLHQYTWKTRSAMLFNNGYFRNMVSKEDWYYATGHFPNGTNLRTTCRGFGNSRGQRPAARWKPHAFGHLKKWRSCAMASGKVGVPMLQHRIHTSCGRLLQRRRRLLMPGRLRAMVHRDRYLACAEPTMFLFFCGFQFTWQHEFLQVFPQARLNKTTAQVWTRRCSTPI
jgi:hypothetical protein